jgi:RimJ/RimL family protein N-acetyltransferase
VAFVLTTDAREFSARAGPFLTATIECNVLATVLMGVLEGRYADVEPLFGYELGPGGVVTAAVMRTPPFPMMTSRLDPPAIGPVLDAWLERDPVLPGVNGPPEAARAFAEAWSGRTGGQVELERAMAMHSLQVVNDPPRPPTGRLRRGERGERDLLIAWWQAFADEAGGYGGRQAAANVDARLAAGSLYVWDDGGPVSLVASQPPVNGVVRIGPVYTPPQCRRHGYAGMAVAEVSRRALAAGAHTCMLFTDLANPTSNKIYAEVGYRRFAEWEEYGCRPVLGPAGGRGDHRGGA